MKKLRISYIIDTMTEEQLDKLMANKADFEQRFKEETGFDLTIEIVTE